MFNRFMIKKKIGSGGLSEVYLAYDFDLKKEVALKCGKEKGVLAREYTLMSGLDCKGIPCVYDCIHSQDQDIICMEYIEGSTLDVLIDDDKYSYEKLIGHIIEVCRIIEYLHETKRILYLDLKPENIIIDGSNVWLVDYGACESIGEHESEVSTVYGTRYFAAPEQKKGGKVFTVRTDVYQIGSLVDYIMNKKKRRNRRINKAAERCMNERACNRYASVGEVAAILADCIGYSGEIIRKEVQ